jgi:hypothetical protein
MAKDVEYFFMYLFVGYLIFDKGAKNIYWKKKSSSTNHFGKPNIHM